MKRIVRAVGVSLATMSSAHAQTAQQRYQGTFFVTAVTGPCTTNPITAEVGDNYVLVFRTEQTRQALALFGTRRAFSFTPSTNGRFAASGSYNAVSIGGGALSIEFTGAYSGFVISPPTPAPTSQAVNMRGVLANFDGVAGCTVNFIGSGARRPEF